MTVPRNRFRKDPEADLPPAPLIPLTVYTFLGIVRGWLILYNRIVIDYLDTLPERLQYKINDTLDDITTFGKQADLPDARRIVQLTDTWESRNQMTVASSRYTIRILIRFHTDDLADGDSRRRQGPVGGHTIRVVRRLRRRLGADLQHDEGTP